MALDRASKKKIALKVAGEIKSVLSDHNGARLLAKHKAKKAAPAPVEQDDEDMEAALGQPDDEMAEGEEMPMAMPGKPTGKGFPFKKSGGGMRGRGLAKG